MAATRSAAVASQGRGDVLIVGGGIVGLSTAYFLAKAGVSVTVVERGPVPNPLASSCDHHRLIRVTYGDSDGYTLRIREAYEAWRTMWADLPGGEDRYYAATGILALSQEAGDWTDRSRITMERHGVPFERIDGIAAIARRFPFVEAANVAYALLSEGGALMANRIMADLADVLRTAGVVIVEHARVDALDLEAGTVRLRDGRTLAGERLVVAAGVETARLVPDLHGTLVPNRSLIVYAEPPEDLAEAWAGAPSWTELGGGKELWGVAPVKGLPAKFGAGHLGEIDETAARRTITDEEMRSVLALYAGRFRAIDRFAIRWGQANYWTLAPDQRFVLGAFGRGLAVSACSGHGFKFGALSGRDVADVVAGAPLETVARRMAGMPAAA